MPSWIPHTADELLSMDRVSLKEVRGRFFTKWPSRSATEEQNEAVLRFATLLTMVQDLVDWRPFAEPGLAGLSMELGGEHPLEDLRKVDRHSIETHRGIASEFEAAGGKPALQAAIDRLNSMDIQERER